MSGPTYFSQPTVERLPVLIKQIAAGEFRIPCFQRPFVWRDDQRVRLLDSIRQGLPIGSILVWRTTRRLEEYERVGPFRIGTSLATGVRTYVIDGHQRLVTLFSALSEPEPVTESTDTDDDGEGDADDVRWPIYYDLEKEEFRFAPRRGRVSDEWLPLAKLLDPKALYEHQKRLLGKKLDVLSSRAEALAEQFKDYSVPVIPLFTEDLGVVTECFRRVNSLGTRMSEVHMLNALGWTGQIDLRRRLRAVKERLQPIGWGELDDQVLIDTIKVAKGLDYYYATPDNLHDALRNDPGALDRLPMDLERAVFFLMDSCGVCGPAMLPYQLQLVLLAEAARVLDGTIEGDVANALGFWFWQTTFTESFTGCSNRDVEEAASLVRALAAGQQEEVEADRRQVVMPVERFRANAVRSRALALLLAEHAPLDETGAPTGGAELLAELGSRALPKIIPSSELPPEVSGEGPENRWIVHPRRIRAMRDLVRRVGDPQRARILESHLISTDAADQLIRGDLRGFLRTRRRALIAMEREVVERTGLTYAEQDEVIPQG